MRGALVNLALSLVAVALTAAGFEAGLRLSGAEFGPEPVTGNQYMFYRFDPELGWSNMPGLRGVFARKEFAYPVRINAHGLRGPDVTIAKPAGVRRIAVLGDSYTWGIGAADADLFTTRLAALVPGSEVLNFGVSGYGPVQHHLLAPQVLAFDPDVAIVAFCLFNDFADNVFWRRYNYYKPYAALDPNGGLVIGGYPLPMVKRFARSESGPWFWLRAHLQIAHMIDTVIISNLDGGGDFGQRGPGASESQSDIYRRPDGAEAAYMIAVNRALFASIAQTFAGHGIPVIVLAVPSKCEIGPCFRDQVPDASRQALARSLAGLPVTLVDPTPAYARTDFWDRDGHWRPSGHAKAAAVLAPTVAAALAAR